MWGVRKRTGEWNSMIRILVWNHVSTNPLFIGQQRHRWPQQSASWPERGTPRALTYPNPLLKTPMERHQRARQLPCHSGHDRCTTRQWEAAPSVGKRGARGTMIRRDDWPRDSTTCQPAIKTGLTPSHLAWRTPKAEGASSWMGHPAQEPSKPRPAAPRLFQNHRTTRGPLTGE